MGLNRSSMNGLGTTDAVLQRIYSGERAAFPLLDMADKGVTMLEIACRKCDRRGRLSFARSDRRAWARRLRSARDWPELLLGVYGPRARSADRHSTPWRIAP
jgi:hypothetical protein